MAMRLDFKNISKSRGSPCRIVLMISSDDKHTLDFEVIQHGLPVEFQSAP